MAPVSTSRVFEHDAPPVVSVASPTQNMLVTGPLHLSATCADDDPSGCKSFTVSIPGGPVLASGTASIAADVSLSAYDGQTVTIRFTGTDSRNQVVQADRAVTVNASSHVSAVGQVPGTLLDADAGRLLYRDAAGALVVRDRSNGAETVAAAAALNTLNGYLAPSGAIFTAKPGTTADVYQWNGGAALAPGAAALNAGALNSTSSLFARGGWAIWSEFHTLRLRDLSAGTTTTASTNAGNVFDDVAADGTVAYWDAAYGVHRYRSGADTTLASATASTWNTYPATDGSLVVFRRTPPCCVTQPASILVFDPATGLAVLSGNATSSPTPGPDYVVAGGWVAYVQLASGSSQKEIWRRAPGGALSKVATVASGAYLKAVGPDGTVVYVDGTHSYAVAAGSVSAADLGLAKPQDRVVTVSGKLVILQDGNALEVTP
jgi:hypothetical protein